MGFYISAGNVWVNMECIAICMLVHEGVGPAYVHIVCLCVGGRGGALLRVWLTPFGVRYICIYLPGCSHAYTCSWRGKEPVKRASAHVHACKCVLSVYGLQVVIGVRYSCCRRRPY